MPIQLTCACGQKMQVKEEHAGKRTKCPACGVLLDIPLANTSMQAHEAPDDPPYDEEAKPRRKRKATDDAAVKGESGGVFSMEKGMASSGIIVGILLMVGAAVWFVAGLAFDRIFFYPPIMFIIGIVAVSKGILNLGKPQDD
jgi:hypothetical protein